MAETSVLLGELVRPAVEGLWPADRATLLKVDLGARPTGSTGPGTVTLVYLAETEFSDDAQEVIRRVLRGRLGSSLEIGFRWLPKHAGPWQYAPGQTIPPSTAREAMGQLVENLKAFPNLVAQIEAGAGAGDPSRRRQEIAHQRAALLARELEKSGVRPDQIVARVSDEQGRTARVTLVPR